MSEVIILLSIAKKLRNHSKRYCLFELLLMMVYLSVSAQVKSFSVDKVPFTSSVATDFSPVVYKNGIVYCSNLIATAVKSIKSEDENLFNILFVEKKDSNLWKSPQLFSLELTTILNEGPATFTPDGNTIYFARNIIIEGKFKEINKPSNTLGIYSAQLIGGIWTNITAFPYNNPEYSLGTPALSPDAKRIYFASDMPGGHGGSDIYYCDFIDNRWSKPVNIGSQINTEFDEAYPFACISGKVFFSSNGHNSIGGKDIFYTVFKDGKWLNPVHLDADINSPDDDYGIITDPNFEQGYFSSNRKRNTDIYSFRAEIPHFGICSEQKEIDQCFKFYDERFTDTLHLEHVWDFGNGIKKKGIIVEQCFSNPGTYTAVLTIVHRIADSTYTIVDEYTFEVKPENSPFILADKASVVNRPVTFNAIENPMATSDTKYYWDFGNGYTQKNVLTKTSFADTGNYTVKLGVFGAKDNRGINEKFCISKPIKICSDNQQLVTFLGNNIKDGNNNLPENKLNPDENSFRIVNYYIGKFQGKNYARMTSVLDSISKFPLPFDENNNPISGTISILDYYIEILNSDPNINLEINIHRGQNNSSKANKLKTDQIAENFKNYIGRRVINNSRFSCNSYGDLRINTSKNKPAELFFNNRIEFVFTLNSTTLSK